MRYHIIAALLMMALSVALSACNRGETQLPPPEVITSGNAANGEQIFNARCTNCHATTTEMRLGPGMAGLFGPNGPTRPPGVTYGSNLPNGQPINEINVATLIRSGGQWEIAYMPPQSLDDQQLADLIAYLKTLE
jgi:cytochrome c